MDRMRKSRLTSRARCEQSGHALSAAAALALPGPMATRLIRTALPSTEPSESG